MATSSVDIGSSSIAFPKKGELLKNIARLASAYEANRRQSITQITITREQESAIRTAIKKQDKEIPADAAIYCGSIRLVTNGNNGQEG